MPYTFDITESEYKTMSDFVTENTTQLRILYDDIKDYFSLEDEDDFAKLGCAVALASFNQKENIDSFPINYTNEQAQMLDDETCDLFTTICKCFSLEDDGLAYISQDGSIELTEKGRKEIEDDSNDNELDKNGQTESG